MSLSLAEYAQAKRLPERFLGELGLRDDAWYDGTPAVVIPYRDQDGAEIATRYRIALDGEQLFRWRKGTNAKGLVYGLDRWYVAAAAGYALLVEGESCAQTAWLHGVPAFGIPGAGMFDDERTSPCLEGIGTLYVVQEPDEASESLVGKLAASRLGDRMRAISFGTEVKDVSEAHLLLHGHHELFMAMVRTALEIADDGGLTSVPATPAAGEQTSEPTDRSTLIRIVPLDVFADTEEEGDEALLGDPDNVLIPENGHVMVYGDGGAGKTTLMLDFACHLAAGDDWLGMTVSKPRRVLVIENEGPRRSFRRKLRRKRDAWEGSPIDGRILVFEEPWAAFTFDHERWREILAEKIKQHEIDVLICGPVACAGMNAAGTLQEVRDFLALVADVRRRSGRPLVVILIHHEGKSGKVSGAWEGAGDTLLHVSGQRHGRTRLYVQKARWASDYHATTLQLAWAPGESFQVEEREQLDDGTIAEQIVANIASNPGTGWGKVEAATPGVNRQRRNGIRDGLLAAGRIVNVRRKHGEPERTLDHIEEAKPAHLYLAEDPTIPQLLPGPGAVGEQTAPAGETRGQPHLLPAPRPIRGAGEQEQPSLPPRPSRDRRERRGRGLVSGPLLAAREAAEYLSVSVSVLRELTRRGELPCVRVTERNTRWRRDDLDAFIDRCREEFPTPWVR